MSLPRPDSREILATLATWLDERAKPALQGELGYEARIALGLVRTLLREHDAGATLGEQDARALAELVPDVAPEVREAELCARIRDGRLAWDDPALIAHLRASVLGAIAIDSPKYPSFAATRAEGFPRR